MRVLEITDEKDSLILRKRSTEISQIDENVKLLAERLILTMDHEMGVGIAAPQVGINKRLFIFTRLDKPGYPVQVAINPKIVNHPENTVCFEDDGCLSIPDFSGNSIRWEWVDVEYYNENGELIKERLEGYSRGGNFTAVVFQHEFDHLDGILFTDKLCNVEE
jgi:peptide deformylase